MAQDQSKPAEEKGKGQNNNTVIITIVALVVVAVGALVYLSGQMKDDVTAANPPSRSALPEEKTENESAPEIVPGNPVVAKVGDQEITRIDVFNFINTLPMQTRQMPLEQLFPLAQEQVINASLIAKKAETVNLDDDPEVKRQLALAKEQIVRNVNLQNAIEAKVTEERIQQAYDDYVASFPDQEEARAFHILVETKEEADEILAKIEAGEGFGDLAEQYSIDGTVQNGGDLGYFLRSDVVEPFGTAVFEAESGALIAEPIKTEFGYHVVRVEDKRMRSPVSFEDAKSEIAANLRRAAVAEVMQEWRAGTEIELFDINGQASVSEAQAPNETPMSEDQPVSEVQ